MKMKNDAHLQKESVLANDFKNKKEINNFLIDRNDELITNLFDKYFCDQKTLKKQFTVKQIGICGDIVNCDNLGIKTFKQKDLAKINPKILVELIVSEIFPAQGKIKIHVRVEQNKKVKNKLFMISDYKIL